MIDITENLIPLPPTAVALGFFDGLHLGHIQVVLETFHKEGLHSAMFTFHSDTALPKREKIENLLSNDMKLSLLDMAGVEYIYSPDFDTVKNYTGEDFVAKILIKIMNAKLVVYGFDFRLGAGAGCDAAGFRKICEKHGIDVIIIPPFSSDGCIVHSTVIKNLIKTGEIEKANKLLGYEFSIFEKVVSGNRLGRTLGYPTINQIYPENMVTPLFGAYKSITFIGDRVYHSITNIGVKPTVNYKNKPLAETHILGYEGDLYGQKIKVSLLSFIRPERKFDDIEALKEQLHRDKITAQQ